MSGTYYKAIGFVVWKAGTWYLRRRYGSAPKKIGTGALAAATITGVAAAVAMRRRSSPSAD